MKKLVKISLSLLIVFACFFLVRLSVSATASTSDGIKIEGAQIRTDAKSGIRFVANYKDYEVPAGRAVAKYGVCVAYGKADANDVTKGNNVNGKSVAFAEDSELDNDENKQFFLTVWNIPTANYEDYITARAYVILDNDDIVYGTTSTARNVADVARIAKAEGIVGEIVDNGALNRDVRVTNGTTVTYYSTLDNYLAVGIAANDEIDLAGGKTYTNDLNITPSHVTITGYYKDVLGTNEDRLANDSLETVLSGTITVNPSADFFNLIGVTSTSSTSIIYKGSQKDSTIQNNIFAPTTDEYSTAISDALVTGEDAYSSYTHTRLTIKGNFFNKVATVTRTRSIDVFLQSYVRDLSITNNKFSNDYNHDDYVNGGSDYDYAIKCNRVSSNAANKLDIKNNVFTKLGSNYVIDLGYSNTDSKRASGIITIENNEMSSSTSQLLGANGIRIFHVGANTVVNIIHNKRFVISRYYNAIFISNTSSAKSEDDTSLPVVNIKFNLFYTLGASNDYNNSTIGRDKVSSKYVRIGVGIKMANNDGNNVNYESNYVSNSGTPASGVYASATSTTGATTSNNPVSPNTSVVTTFTEANDAYDAYLKN